MGLFWLQQWLSPGKGTGQMTSFFSFGPSNVQPILFSSFSPTRLAHKLIQEFPHLSRLARGQLVGQCWQERRFAEVGGQAKSWHLIICNLFKLELKFNYKYRNKSNLGLEDLQKWMDKPRAGTSRPFSRAPVRASSLWYLWQWQACLEGGRNKGREGWEG